MSPNVRGFLAFASNSDVLPNIFLKLYKLYTDYSERNDTKEKILLSLSSIQPLIKSVERRERIINELKVILEDATTSRDKFSGQIVYQNIGELMLAMSDYLDSLHLLASQAKIIERFEKFQQIKNYDTLLYDFVKMLSRSYENDQLSLEEFPIFLTMHGPKYKPITTEIKEQVKKELNPFIKGVNDFLDNLPRPFRPQQKLLIKSLKKLIHASSKYKKIDQETEQQLKNQAPDWMKVVYEIVGQETDKLPKLMKKGFRN